MHNIPWHVKHNHVHFMPWHDKLRLVPGKRTKPITLQEHLKSIAAKGGRARAEKLSAEEQSEIGRKAGEIGGRARSKKLTARKRSEIAKKAAAARWAKKAK